MRGPRRSLWLAVAAALAVTGLQALPTGTAAAKPSPTADDHRVVRRSADGHVTFLGSTDARPLAASPQAGGAVAAARAHLDQLGRSLGLSQPLAELTRGRKTALGQGRSVVRFDQQVGGVPVFGGQVAVSLAADGSLTSVLSDVSSATQVSGTTVSQARAKRTALSFTSKAEGVAAENLSVASARKVVFDPDVIHLVTPSGVGPAWEVEVTNGFDVRELVIVGGSRGAVLLHFNQVADALNRRVCNNQNVQQGSDVPCTSPVRVEGQGATGTADVDNAYLFAGRTANAYSSIAGLDLTEFIGKGTAGHRQLRSTVLWCVTGDACPYANAYWNGEQMYYGQGYASADDVVAHELTHGVTQRTSNLMYTFQSGAMNESFSDIFGEVVDHRTTNLGEDPEEWLLGEDLGDGPFRSMADPTIYGDPDRMTSANYVADNYVADNGGVHTNSGVGNKLFYLIAHGQVFNGQDVAAIDSDPGLPKSARLFYEALVSLNSGSEYADLANVLRQRCGELASASTVGFTTGDCTEVDQAIAATELEQSPPGDAAQPADAPSDCPDPNTQFKTVLFDGEAQSDALTPDNTSMWTRAPNYSWGIAPNARSGVGSWFVWNLDPSIGDPADSGLMMDTGVTVPAGQPTYVRFEHWRVFEWSTSGPTYYDGGTLDLWKDNGGGTYVPVDNGAYTWDNGPSQPIVAVSARLGFGGDSHGWVSSRMDLSPMAGNKIKLAWTSHGDPNTWVYGWFIDNIEIYTCPTVDTRTVTAAQHFNAVATGTPGSPAANLSWDGPATVGAGIDHFRIVRSGVTVKDVVAGDPQPVRIGNLKPNTNYTFKVVPVDHNGLEGPAVSHTIRAIKIAFAASKTRVHKGDPVTFSGRVYRADNGKGIKGLRVYFQYKKPSASKWSTLGYLKTRIGGKYNVRLLLGRTYVYRTLVRPSAKWFTNVSPTRTVVVR